MEERCADRFTWGPGELRHVRSDQEVLAVLAEAKRLAREYRRLTGKPLGITGEVAEFEAARILRVKLTVARQEGYDATETVGPTKRHLQIKGRCILPGSKPGQRLGGIKLDKPFDAVLMVLLDEEFNATEIYEAERRAVEEALTRPGSKSRNERGALSVGTFKAIGRLRWRRSELDSR
jgi:hypothetical protein